MTTSMITSMTTGETWYIVKQTTGQCDIQSAEDMPEQPANNDTPNQPEREVWGPFSSRPEAIARRVGLIRAGKCAPT